MIGRNHLRGSFHFDEGRAWLNQLMTVLEYWDPLQFWHTSSDSSHWVRRYTTQNRCRIQWWIKTASPWSSRQSNLYSSFILPSRNLGLYPFYPFYPPSSHIRDQLLRAHRLPRRAPHPKMCLFEWWEGSDPPEVMCQIGGHQSRKRKDTGCLRCMSPGPHRIAPFQTVL